MCYLPSLSLRIHKTMISHLYLYPHSFQSFYRNPLHKNRGPLFFHCNFCQSGSRKKLLIFLEGDWPLVLKAPFLRWTEVSEDQKDSGFYLFKKNQRMKSFNDFWRAQIWKEFFILKETLQNIKHGQVYTGKVTHPNWTVHQLFEAQFL